jgi:pimeloyl-ACP methyl ester carboxylesterase
MKLLDSFWNGFNIVAIYSSLIPSAKFELLMEAGHFPQMERLDKVMELLQAFAKK